MGDFSLTFSNTHTHTHCTGSVGSSHGKILDQSQKAVLFKADVGHMVRAANWPLVI